VKTESIFLKPKTTKFDPFTQEFYEEFWIRIQEIWKMSW